MKRSVISSLRVVCIALITTSIGCSTKHYQVTLKPDGDAIERTIVCWQTQADKPLVIESFPKDELQKIAAVYGADPGKKLKQRHTFKGHFIGEMPNDLDNSGTFTRWNSPFGTTSTYAERFGGSDDIGAQVEALKRIANKGVDFSIAWLQTELGDEPHWNELKEHLDTTVRRDLINLAYIILIAAGSDDSFNPTMSFNESFDQQTIDRASLVGVRLLQYLVEHDYIEVADIPAFMQLSSRGDKFVEKYMGNFSKRLLCKGMGIKEGEAAPASFAFLSSSEALKASWTRYVKSTPEYQKIEQEWKEKLKKHPKEKAPEPSEVASMIVWGDEQVPRELATSIVNFGGSRTLEISLYCSGKPITTNGKWDEKEGRVSWKTERNDKFGLPPVAEAIWSEPNVDEQKKRFGEVILTGASLSGYVMWYAGMTKEESKEWDSFAETWKPGPDLVRSIENFRFATDQPIEQRQTSFGTTATIPPSLADFPRRLISDAMKESTKRHSPASPTP